MKYIKPLVIIMLLLTALFTGCQSVTPITPPQSKIITSSPSLQQGTTQLTEAYITATDIAIKLATDAHRSTSPEFISFGFGTTFSLKQSERNLFVKAFENYGIPLDTRGTNPPARTEEEMSKGYVVLFPTGAQHKDPNSDLTIAVEICHTNKGYVYYFDFSLVGGKYILTNYMPAYEENNPLK